MGQNMSDCGVCRNKEEENNIQTLFIRHPLDDNKFDFSTFQDSNIFKKKSKRRKRKKKKKMFI